MRLLSTTVFILILFTACAPLKPSEKPLDPIGLLYIDGNVQSVSGNEVVLSLNLPELKRTEDAAVNEIAQQVIQKSLIIEGVKIDINGVLATVKEIRGNAAVIIFDLPTSLSSGSAIKIKVPKKTIAIIDFEVIKGGVKELGRVTMEGLTSTLINSGQFVVVERTKLKAIVDELQLSQSGLTQETPDKVIGKLFIADLILTGTLAEVRNMWDVNLRLLNVRTGQAIAAITLKTSLFKPEELRDAGSLEDDFETEEVDRSWRIGNGPAGLYNVAQDDTQGVENSKKSLKMSYDFIKPLPAKWSINNFFARIINMKKRDLSFYNGVEFYAKSDSIDTCWFVLFISERENVNNIDAWVASFPVKTEWKRVKIPFNQLSIGRHWIKEGADKLGAKPGKQIFDLSRVEFFSVMFERNAYLGNKGNIWIDKIKFYRD